MLLHRKKEYFSTYGEKLCEKSYNYGSCGNFILILFLCATLCLAEYLIVIMWVANKYACETIGRYPYYIDFDIRDEIYTNSTPHIRSS